MNKKLAGLRARLWPLVGLAALGFLLVFVRAVDLQAWHRDALAAKAVQQRKRLIRVAAPRGPILDAAGRVLAESVEVPSIAGFSGTLLQQRDRLGALAKALGLSEGELVRRLQRRSGFVWLARQVSPQLAERVRALAIDGVHIEREWRRFYPLGPAAGHLIGFVGIDGNGLEGVELAFEARLRGEPGIKEIVRDARGRVLQTRWQKAPRPGGSLRLTIDATLQAFAYAALADAVRRLEAKGGSVVVLRVSDAAVLAMVNQPGFNPNDIRRFRSSDWRNRAITDLFEPGSALKPFTYAAALLAGHRPAERLDCGHGALVVADRVIHDEHPFGRLSLQAALARSSNVCAAKIGLALGAERLHAMLAAFGFGRKTGIGLPGEASGILHPPERWGPVETATIAFGQGVATTALQLATAYAAIASDGLWRRPRIVADAPVDAGRVVLPKAVARQLRAMLQAAVARDATGWRAVPAGWRVAGKTGTAQKPSPHGGYDPSRHDAVFAGFAPADRPQIVVVVRLDEPKRAFYGGTAAAPVFRRIVAHALPYLGVTPQARFVQARLHLPEDEVGMSLRELRRLAHQRGLRLVVHGSGWLVRARPANPARLDRGDVWEVWLAE